MEMGALYLTSGLLGFALAAGLLFAWTGPIMIILTALFVLVAVLIALFKDNKIQSWLEHTLWGAKGDLYKSLEVEQKQLELALKG